MRGELFENYHQEKEKFKNQVEEKSDELQPCTSASLICENKIKDGEECEKDKNKEVLLDFENLRQANDENYDYRALEVLLSENVVDLQVKKCKIGGEQVPITVCPIITPTDNTLLSQSVVETPMTSSNVSHGNFSVSTDISKSGNSNAVPNLPNKVASDNNNSANTNTQVPKTSSIDYAGQNNFNCVQPQMMANVSQSNYGYPTLNSFPNQFGYNPRQMSPAIYWGNNNVSTFDNNMSFMAMQQGNGCFLPGMSQPMNMAGNFVPFGTMPNNFVGNTNNASFYGPNMANVAPDNHGMSSFIAPNAMSTNDNMPFNQF